MWLVATVLDSTENILIITGSSTGQWAANEYCSVLDILDLKWWWDLQGV